MCMDPLVLMGLHENESAFSGNKRTDTLLKHFRINVFGDISTVLVKVIKGTHSNVLVKDALGWPAGNKGVASS